jgi:hypothetical protein
MKHSKRHKLTCKDVNKALKWSDSQPIHGHGINGSHIKDVRIEGEKTPVFFAEDPPVDLVCLAEEIIQSKNRVRLASHEERVQLKWLAFDGSMTNPNTDKPKNG